MKTKVVKSQKTLSRMERAHAYREAERYLSSHLGLSSFVRDCAIPRRDGGLVVRFLIPDQQEKVAVVFLPDGSKRHHHVGNCYFSGLSKTTAISQLEPFS
jgi:hypothetical protein